MRYGIGTAQEAKELGLLDLDRLHPRAQQMIERIYIAVSQMYPDGEFGARRVIDVARITKRDVSDLVMAQAFDSAGGQARPYVLFPVTWFGTSGFETLERTAPVLRSKGYVLPTTDPVLSACVHELLHPAINLILFDAVKRGTDNSGFLSEIRTEVRRQTGIRLPFARRTTNNVEALRSNTHRVGNTLSIHASRNWQEFLAEALTEGLLCGPDASALGKIVRNAFDRRMRFDSPLAAQFRAHTEKQLSDSLREPYAGRHIKRRITPLTPYASCEAQELKERSNVAGALPKVPWLPLDMSGRVSNGTTLYTTDVLLPHLHVDSESNRQVDPDLTRIQRQCPDLMQAGEVEIDELSGLARLNRPSTARVRQVFVKGGLEPPSGLEP